MKGGPLRPEVTLDRWGVALIFLISGLGLRTAELRAAATHWRLNALAQAYSLGAMPLAGAALARATRALGWLPGDVVDGLAVLACLPTTVNMCVVLSSSAGANVAAALFNAVLGNALGIVASPLLIVGALAAAAAAARARAAAAGSRSHPRCASSACASPRPSRAASCCGAGRATARARASPPHKPRLARLSEALLLGLVYAAFCEAFGTRARRGRRRGRRALGARRARPRARAAARVRGRRPRGCSRSRARGCAALARGRAACALAGAHKTLALGVPMINALFGGSGGARLAALQLPLLLWHPIQLLVGSIAMPYLRAWIAAADRAEGAARRLPTPQERRGTAGSARV